MRLNLLFLLLCQSIFITAQSNSFYHSYPSTIINGSAFYSVKVFNSKNLIAVGKSQNSEGLITILDENGQEISSFALTDLLPNTTSFYINEIEVLDGQNILVSGHGVNMSGDACAGNYTGGYDVVLTIQVIVGAAITPTITSGKVLKNNASSHNLRASCLVRTGNNTFRLNSMYDPSNNATCYWEEMLMSDIVVENNVISTVTKRHYSPTNSEERDDQMLNLIPDNNGNTLAIGQTLGGSAIQGLVTSFISNTGVASNLKCWGQNFIPYDGIFDATRNRFYIVGGGDSGQEAFIAAISGTGDQVLWSHNITGSSLMKACGIRLIDTVLYVGLSNTTNSYILPIPINSVYNTQDNALTATKINNFILGFSVANTTFNSLNWEDNNLFIPGRKGNYPALISTSIEQLSSSSCFDTETLTISPELNWGIQQTIGVFNDSSNDGLIITDFNPSLYLKNIDYLSECALVTTHSSEQNANPITLFPNPTNGQFTGIFPTDVNQIEVYDAIGKKIMTTQNNNIPLDFDLTLQPAGVYFLRTDKGQTQKIIKQ